MRWIGPVWMSLVALGAGCEPGKVSPRCAPDEVVACPCEDGTVGQRTCRPDGTWSPCSCAQDGGSGSDVGPGRDGSAPCDGVTCSGHGTCRVSGGQAECVCDPGYHAQGLECVADADPCDGVTCSGHGTCRVSGGQAECVCDPGYHPVGLSCEQDDPCDGVTCSGHGTCQVSGGQAECVCDPGYHAQGLACVEDGGTCPPALADRVTVTTLDVSPDQVNTSAGGYFSPLTPPILAPLPAGAKVAWGDTSGLVHVTPLDDQNRRAGPDVTIPANELRGLAAHQSGYAVLVQRGEDEMAFVGFNSADQQVFDVTIVGNTDHDQTWAKWIRRDWSHYGRVAYHAGTYATYFGHVMNWGADGVHQGDLLYFYDLSGNQTQVGWDWGCSHSLDVRIAHDGSRFGPVCLSDCFPQKAIMYNHQQAVIHDEPSGDCSGYSEAELGGLVALGGSLYLTFVSPEGRASRDVALVGVTNGQVGTVHWLTDTPNQEGNAHLAVYGSNLLVAWQAGSSLEFAVVDTSGNFLVGPETVSGVAFDQQTDFVNYANGDVGWAFAAGSTLSIVRLTYCE